MKLSTRLLLLIIGCLLPIVTAQIYSQTNLNAERHHNMNRLALRRAIHLMTDFDTTLDNVRQFGLTISQFPELRSSDAACRQHLNTLRQQMPRYQFLTIAAADTGATLCGSDGSPAQPGAGGWITAAVASHDLAIGQPGTLPGQPAAFVPIAVYLPAEAGAAPHVLITGLDIGWLSQSFDAGMMIPAPDRPAALVIRQDGRVIARSHDGPRFEGTSLPDWLRPVMGHTEPGTVTVTAGDGATYVAAFVPNALSSDTLTLVNLAPAHVLTGDLDQATWQDLLVIGGSALVAVILAWIAGRRFIYRPTGILLQAARRWREGDLSARAAPLDPGSEFDLLGQAFNAMAAELAAREKERRAQADFLETQVAERTRELSETNNRLQVEIANREKTEAALHQAQKLQAVGQLAGGIAHDFNNMLATVLGNLELMERRVAQLPEKASTSDTDRLLRLIERAVGAVQRGGQLTSRLLAFSRRQRLAARPTDINALVQELITLATSTLGRRIQVVAELQDDLWAAMVDPSQVEAAILNLCLNARDAMPEGGQLTIGTTNLSIAGGHPELTPGEYIQVTISDTGLGMTPDVEARAFEPFFTTKGPGAGSGLGLSQVYGMARQSGGSVSLHSTPGTGTRVVLCLPRALTEATPETRAAEPGAPTQVATGRARELILVVDDDNAVRQVTVEMARDLGFEVAQATGGDHALAVVEKLSPPPHIILLDYAMPGMNGLQLARALRERGIVAPIALVTGYAELSEADVRGAELGGLLRKPFTIRELQALLQQLRDGNAEPEKCLEAGIGAQ